MAFIPPILAAGRAALVAGRVLPWIGRVGGSVVRAFGGVVEKGMNVVRGAERGRATYRSLNSSGDRPDNSYDPPPEVGREDSDFWKGAATGAAVAGGVALAATALANDDNSGALFGHGQGPSPIEVTDVIPLSEVGSAPETSSPPFSWGSYDPRSTPPTKTATEQLAAAQGNPYKFVDHNYGSGAMREQTLAATTGSSVSV